MKKQEIIETVRDLSKSQGFYCRMLEHLQSEDGQEFLDMLEAKNFKDPVDLILYFEG